MAKAMFEVNGKVFPTMLAVAKELGRSRVYRGDFDKLGITEISEDEVREVEAEVAMSLGIIEEESEPVAVEEPEVVSEPTKAKSTKQSNKLNPLTQEQLTELRSELGMETIFTWAVGVKEMSTADIKNVLTEKLGYTEEQLPKVLNKGSRMHLVRMFRERLYPGEERPKVGAKAFREFDLERLVSLYVKAGFVKDDIKGDTDKAKRRYVLRVFRENNIHHPDEIEQ